MLTSTTSLISLVCKTHMMSHFTLARCIVLHIARNPLSCDLPRTTFGKVTVEVICLMIAKGAYSLFKNGYLSIIPCQRAYNCKWPPMYGWTDLSHTVRPSGKNISETKIIDQIKRALFKVINFQLNKPPDITKKFKFRL